MSSRPADLRLMSIGERLGPDLNQYAPHLRLRPHDDTWCVLDVVDGRRSHLSREQMIQRAELDRLLSGYALVREYMTIQPSQDGATVRFLSEEGEHHEALVESEDLREWLSTWAKNLGL